MAGWKMKVPLGAAYLGAMLVFGGRKINRFPMVKMTLHYPIETKFSGCHQLGMNCFMTIHWSSPHVLLIQNKTNHLSKVESFQKKRIFFVGFLGGRESPHNHHHFGGISNQQWMVSYESLPWTDGKCFHPKTAKKPRVHQKLNLTSPNGTPKALSPIAS